MILFVWILPIGGLCVPFEIFYTISAKSKGTQRRVFTISFKRFSRHDYCFYEMFAETLLENHIHQNLIYSLSLLSYRVASLPSHFSTLWCIFQLLELHAVFSDLRPCSWTVRTIINVRLWRKQNFHSCLFIYMLTLLPASAYASDFSGGNKSGMQSGCLRPRCEICRYVFQMYVIKQPKNVQLTGRTLVSAPPTLPATRGAGV